MIQSNVGCVSASPNSPVRAHNFMPFENIWKLGCDREKKPRRHCHCFRNRASYFSRGISSPPQTCRGSQACCFGYLLSSQTTCLLFWANSHISIRRVAFHGFLFFTHKLISRALASHRHLISNDPACKELFSIPSTVVDFPTDVMITNKTMGIFSILATENTAMSHPAAAQQT